MLINVRIPTKEEKEYLGDYAKAITKEFVIGHVLNNDSLKERVSEKMMSLDKQTIEEAQKVFKENMESTVDLKTARVSGIFEDLGCAITFDIEVMIKTFKLEPAEMTAIFLHELGHIFNCYEFSNRISRTNQALALTSKLLMEKCSIEQLKYNYRLIGDKLINDQNVFNGLEDIKDNTVIATVIVDKVLKHASSELGLEKYDLSSSEYLADQFASRQGYGKDLILALHKINVKNTLTRDSYYPMLATVFDSIGLLALGLIPFGIIAGTGGIVAGVMASGIFTVSITFALGVLFSYDYEDYTYDTVRTRYLRIKEQLVERIKDNKLNSKIVKNILEDLKSTDEVISKVTDYESIFTKINLFFSKKNRDIKDAIQLQRDLEELSSNDLFIKSAKLKLI